MTIAFGRFDPNLSAAIDRATALAKQDADARVRLCAELLRRALARMIPTRQPRRRAGR